VSADGTVAERLRAQLLVGPAARDPRAVVERLALSRAARAALEREADDVLRFLAVRAPAPTRVQA
jgi:hypothetical protein